MKVIFLFLAVFYTLVNLTKTYYKQNIEWVSFIPQAIGITGFIYLQFLV